MMYNFTLQDDAAWKAVGSKPLPPCMMPCSERGGGMVITNAEPQDLVAYAVKQGLWLSVDTIRKIFRTVLELSCGSSCENKDWPVQDPEKTCLGQRLDQAPFPRC